MPTNKNSSSSPSSEKKRSLKKASPRLPKLVKSRSKIISLTKTGLSKASGLKLAGSENLGFNTGILHSDIRGGSDHGAIHHGIQPSVTFGYQKVEDLIAVFQNRKKGYAYSRNSSPSTAALERQITALEGGRSSLVFSTGLAAITATFLSLLKNGDHIVTSRYLFGNTHSFFTTLLRLGYAVDFVDTCDAKEVRKALRPETKFLFAETIANPSTQIPDWEGIAHVLKQHEKKERKIVSIVDNTLTTPYLFCPRDWGFSFSINSLTKYMAGQGSVLAGSLTDLGNWKGTRDENILAKYQKLQPKDFQMMQIRKKGMRDLGPTLSPFAAHLVSLGLETLSLRMEKHLSNAQEIAEFLHLHPRVKSVYYPGLKSHPQYLWARKWYRGQGGILSFVLHDDVSYQRALPPSTKSRLNRKLKRDPLIDFFNTLKLVIKSSHLGDARTLAIPVAKTIFHEMGLEKRQEMGIDENQVRLSVGIEDPEDIIADLAQALNSI